MVAQVYAWLYLATNLFVLLAAAGLITDFGLQAAIDMTSSLHPMPIKGSTLPFISFAGSSLLAPALAMSMFLALTSAVLRPGESRLSEIPLATTSGRISQRCNWGVRNRNPAVNGFLPRRVENGGQVVVEPRVRVRPAVNALRLSQVYTFSNQRATGR